MELEELNKMWVQDCKIDDTNLSRAASIIPELHNKYYRFYMKEALKVKRLKADLVMLEKDKTEYYAGTMSEEDLKQRGWPPNRLKILRQDINKYIESDKDIIKLSLTIDYHSSVANYLEEIIRQINSRNFIIKNMLEWSKFQSGGF
jgi:hypothetical protein